MRTVFLYAGQGSQKPGMGMDIYEAYPSYREVIDSLELSFDVKKMMTEADADTLSQTQYTQPCMAAFAAGVTRVLKENGIVPDGACGLSLGEYGALFAAGVFDAETYVKLTEFRGSEMAKAAEGKECSMSAVLGMESTMIEEACEACQSEDFVKLVNYNCPGQYVICGDEPAVCAVENYLKEKGAKRCIRLKVSGPFHTKYMKPAADKLMEYMKELEFAVPEIALTLNVTGDFYKEGQDLKELLEKQIQNSVYFENDIRCFIESGVTVFVEIGPGNALSGFVKKTAREMGKDVEIFTIDKVEDLNALIEKKEELFGE